METFYCKVHTQAWDNKAGVWTREFKAVICKVIWMNFCEKLQAGPFSLNLTFKITVTLHHKSM